MSPIDRALSQTDQPPARRWLPRRLSLSNKILIGLVLGIAAGVFFGEECARLSFVGDAFIGLLRMTVLPYIVVSLIANLGRLSLTESRRLAVVGGLILFALWLLGLAIVFVVPMCFPKWSSGSFFSSAITEPPPSVDLVDLFIPDNIFSAIAENRVAAVVLACILFGLALGRVENRAPLIALLDTAAKTLMRVSMLVTRLAPLGVFALAANAAGTMPLEDVPRLQAYFLAFTAGALLLALVILPVLVSVTTPFRYGQILQVARAPMLAAFATGKLIIVLPMLIEETERLFERLEHDGAGTAPTVDVLYPLAYPFPHTGKLLGLLFIPFAAWFLGKAMALMDYPAFLASGLFAYFGGPILATPYLLDQMHLPHDMFQLFLVSGVYAERLGDATGAMHLLAFTVLTTCALTGRLELRWMTILKYLLAMTLVVGTITIGLRAVLIQTLSVTENRSEVINRMQLIEHTVESTVLAQAAPNPDPLLPGEMLLERIRRRGVIRIGFNADKLPFAYFNSQGDLVGFDVNLAYALASDLQVAIEFVPFDRTTLAQQLADDNFDVVMSGLVGTLERSEAMWHTSPYMEVRLALVVPDYESQDFRSLESIRAQRDLRLGFVDLSRGFAERLKRTLPDVELVELSTNRLFFEHPNPQLDALLTSAESGSAFTLLYPEYEVVVPSGTNVSLPLFYAIGARDAQMREFLEHWVSLRKMDGTMQEYYDHWILGKNVHSNKPRWCIARDVLGWID